MNIKNIKNNNYYYFISTLLLLFMFFIILNRNIVVTFIDKNKFENIDYNKSEISLIYTNLSENNRKILLKKPYFKFLNELLFSADFDDDNLDNYISYINDNDLEKKT